MMKLFSDDSLDANEVETLLRRLEKELGQPLARDLRQRLREYSQGLPWLFKKLAGHLLREVKQGATQEQLASEALNVQSLFDADLAELGPIEQEALRHIARYAPISIGEVMDRVRGPILESLVNRRLVVQVGERLDTYWDIFRDYLNTGRIPVEDSYILRQSPVSVARLLREVMADDGDSRVPDIASRLGIAENGVFNLSRELRLLGATAYEPNRVRLLPEIWEADNREHELRRRVAGSLRRHRAYTTFMALAERAGGVTVNAYARELPAAFPAVDVSSGTWGAYARVYLQWFEYAGLVVQKDASWLIAPEGTIGVKQLLGGRIVRRIRGGFPQAPAGPALELLVDLSKRPGLRYEQPVPDGIRATARSLILIGAVSESPDGDISICRPDLVVNGHLVSEELLKLLIAVPGVPEGLAVIESNPTARADEVGMAVRTAISADWAPVTSAGVGKHLRSWARAAGLDVPRAARSSSKPDNSSQVSLALGPRRSSE